MTLNVSSPGTMLSMVSGAELHEEVAQRLARHDQRYTGNRRELVTVLAEAGRPLTPGELSADGTGIAQSSAYRNLTVLTEAGVLRRVVGDDEFSRFELSEDISGHHHHHLVCRRCGSVYDITLPAELEEAMHATSDYLADNFQFTVEEHRFDLLGCCRSCAEADAAS